MNRASLAVLRLALLATLLALLAAASPVAAGAPTLALQSPVSSPQSLPSALDHSSLITHHSSLAQWQVRVVTNRAEVEFPRAVRFRLEAEQASEATAEAGGRATLVHQSANQGVQVRARATAVEAAPGLLAVEYRWHTESAGVPPGVDVRYWWELERADGARWATPPEVFTYTDTRFNWRRLERGAASVLWYDGDDAFGRRLLDAVHEATDWFEREFDVQTNVPTRLLAYASIADLQSAMGRGTAGWVGGGAYPQFGVVLAAVSPRSSEDRLRRVVRHEMAHLLVRVLTGDSFADPPQWLDEGLAMLAEGEPEPRFTRAVAGAAREGRLISLRALSSAFPPDHDTAHLSYAQSQAVVRFIVDRYGTHKLRDMLAAYRDGASDDEAARRALGLGIDQLDGAWRAALAQQPPAAQPADPLLGPLRRLTPSLPRSPLALLGATATALILAAALIAALRRRAT